MISGQILSGVTFFHFLEKDQAEDTPPLPPSKGPTRTHRQGRDMGFFCFALHRGSSFKEKCHFDCMSAKRKLV